MYGDEKYNQDAELIRDICIKYGRERDGEYTLLFNRYASASVMPLRWDEERVVCGVKYFESNGASVITVHLCKMLPHYIPLPDYFVLNALSPEERLRVMGMVSFYFTESTRKIYGIRKRTKRQAALSA